MRIPVPKSRHLLVPYVRRREHRQLLFAPLAVLAALVLFVLLGLATNVFPLALVLAILLAPLVAHQLLGAPIEARERDLLRTRVPISPERLRWLFFPLGTVLAIPFYVLVGLVFTGAGVVEASAWMSLILAAVLGFLAAYIVTGFPRIPRKPSDLLPPVPAERKPLLFVPAGLLLMAILYFALGVAFTTTLGPEQAVLPAIGISAALGFGAAYAAFGIPRPGEAIRVPEVPKRYENVVFGIVVLVLGPILGLVLGSVAGPYVPVAATAGFTLFLLFGFLFAFGLACALLGAPRTAQPLRAYIPRLPAEARPLLLLLVTLAIGTVLTAILDSLIVHQLHTSLLVGFPLALLFALKITRTERLLREGRGRIESLPDKVKPLFLFPLWIFLSVVLYSGIAYVVTSFVPALLASASLALAASLMILERALLSEWLATRRAEREQRKRMGDRLRDEAARSR